MPIPATTREQRLRKTKAQLIDEIDTLEQRVAALDFGREQAFTERKQAEREFAEKEAHLRTALDNLPGGIALEDRDRNYVFFNSKYGELHDYPERFLKVGMSLREEARFQVERGDYGPGKKDVLVEQLLDLYQEGQATSWERTLPNGRTLRFSMAPTPEGGNATIVTDISELKRREKELAEKETQLRVALDSMPGGIRLVDKDLNYVFFNSQYHELYDFPEGLLKVGASFRVENLYQAQRGDHGPGDPEELADKWLAEWSLPDGPTDWERTTASGKILQVNTSPTPDGGVVNVVTDITERKKTEEALRLSEQRHSMVTMAMTEGLYDWDITKDTLYVSPRLNEIFGFEEGELTSKDWIARVHADDREIYRLALVRYFKQETSVLECEYRIRYTESDERWVSDRAIAQRDDQGRAVRLIGAIADITERKRAEEALAEKEAQLRLALDNMPNGMVLVDRDRNIVLFNSQYNELHDYPDGLLKVGESAFDETRFQAERGDYGPGDPDTLMEDAHATFESTEPASYERTLPNGRTLHFSAGPTPDGGYVTMATDISELKRREKELAEKEAQLRVALDNMPGGMMLGDRDLNHVLFNSQYSELHEFPDGLIRVGGSFRDELRYQVDRGDFGPGDKDDLIERVIATNKSGEAESYERAIAGSGRTIQVYVAPTPEGGYVTIVTDITERKRAEEALFEAKRRTEEASSLVAEKNRMLEALSNQLSKYLSPQVYASIFSGEQTVEIASKRKKLTVFFSDIADFAGTTDSLESEELTNLLNHYLTEMSKIALDYGATIDKYVGDSIIAFFGDPETRGVKEDARACVNMAIAMQRRMRELHSEWLDMGLEQPFQVRMGINTGFCTVGNFGSEDRMDYTIIGNEVNLAARLESLAEVGGILMAHETHSLVKDTVMAEEGDTLTVKGFAKPVRTYSVVGLYDDLAEQGRVIRKEHGGVRVLVDMNKGDKADAIQAIKDVLSQLED